MWRRCGSRVYRSVFDLGSTELAREGENALYRLSGGLARIARRRFEVYVFPLLPIAFSATVLSLAPLGHPT